MKNFKLIIKSILIILVILIIGQLAINSEAAIGSERTSIKKEIIQPYKYSSPSYTKIGLFPINAGVFNRDSDYYCAQHGVAYGTNDENTTLGLKTHKSYSNITQHYYFIEWNRKGEHIPQYTDRYGVHYTEHYLDCGSDDGDKLDTARGERNYEPYFFLEVNTINNKKYNDTIRSNKNFFWGYKQAKDKHNSEEEPKDTVYTNWYYVQKDFQYDCEDKKSGFNKGVTSDGAVAFMEATFKQTDAQRGEHGYRNDPLQRTVWTWVSTLSTDSLTYANNLENVAKQYDSYHEKSKNPNVDVTPDTNVSSVYTDTSENTIKIGPFTMSNYVRAEDFTYTFNRIVSNPNPNPKENDKTFTIPTVSGETVSSDIVSGNLQNRMKDHIGSIIKAEAIFTNGNGATKTIEIPIPQKNENFYININKSSIEGYDELKDIVFTYQRIHASGAATLYTGYQQAINFDQSGDNRDSSCTYDCGTCKHTGIDFAHRSGAGVEHAYWCLGSGYCANGNSQGTIYNWGDYNSSCSYSWACGKYSHTHTSSCNHSHTPSCYHSHKSSCYDVDGNLTCTLSTTITRCGKTTSTLECGCYEHTHSISSCGMKHKCTKDCCKDGYKYGKHEAGYARFTAAVTKYCKEKTECKHGHTTCKIFTWKANNPAGDYAQDGIATNGKLIDEKIKYTINVQVPVKTNMSIFKYINKLEHTGESKVYYNSTDRENKTMDEKKKDFMKIEVGDLVEYKILIKNASRFDTRIKALDILPANCDLISCDESKLGIQNNRAQDWIEVKANQTKTITLKIRPTNSSAIDTLYENNVKFTTRNHTETHMQYTSYGKTSTHGEHTHGSIINTNSREEDADYYKVKAYNIIIDKYIYDVKHKYSDEDKLKDIKDTTYTAGTQRSLLKGFTEANKSSKPVYVEYGDTVYYKIDIYNTMKKDNIGVSRKDSPYYEPEKVYVNLTDKLPNSFSNLNIYFEDSTGKKEIYKDNRFIARNYDYEDSVTIALNNNKLEIDGLTIKAGECRSIYISLVVEEHKKETIESNEVKINSVKNINRSSNNFGKGQKIEEDKYCVVDPQDTSNNKESKDFYKLNDYSASITKFISGYTSNMTNENNNDLKITQENNNIAGQLGGNNNYGNLDSYIRYKTSEQDKKNHPLQVEKTDELVYAIVVSNNKTSQNDNKDIASGTKNGTQIRPTMIVEYMEEGLEAILQEKDRINTGWQMLYNLVIHSKTEGATNYIEGYVIRGSKVEKVAAEIKACGQEIIDGKTYNKYTIDNDTLVLNPGDYVVYEVPVKVKESNMYLYSLENKADLTLISNINELPNDALEHRRIKESIADETEQSGKFRNDFYEFEGTASPIVITSDYIKMKDLVISGKVWLDSDKDGYMKLDDTKKLGTAIDVSTEPSSNIEQDINKSEKAMKGIVVKLYSVDKNGNSNLERTTKTDSEGIYTFGRNEGLSWYNGTYDALNSQESEQRIPKANNKDGNKNYTSSSEYMKYYIEYEYDGIVYKATEIYSGMDNLKELGLFKEAYGLSVPDSDELQKLRSDNQKEYKVEYKYLIDSNADELDEARAAFDKKYGVITYNAAYDYEPSNENDIGAANELKYEKDGHNSYLRISPSRVMTARSFVNIKESGAVITEDNTLKEYRKITKTLIHVLYGNITEMFESLVTGEWDNLYKLITNFSIRDDLGCVHISRNCSHAAEWEELRQKGIIDREDYKRTYRL